MSFPRGIAKIIAKIFQRAINRRLNRHNRVSLRKNNSSRMRDSAIAAVAARRQAALTLAR